MSNVGLLVRSWGRVTGAASGNKPCFLIDDGSGHAVKVLAPAGFELPTAHTVAVATGISCMDIHNGDPMRAIRARISSDIVYPPK